MFAIVWENLIAPALAAAIAGGLLLVGNMQQNRETRRRSTEQHVEQTGLLNDLVAGQAAMKQDVAKNRLAAENGHLMLSAEMAEVRGQLSGVAETSSILFSMIAEVDTKVTRPSHSKKKTMTVETEVSGE